jgi:tRNA A37 threonylcarbamoyladenosine modification protein TsaB
MKYDISHFPTILLIDATKREQTRSAVITNKEVFEVAKEQRAQDLQEIVLETLQKSEIKISDLKAVAVLHGNESVTGNRIGATTANTLAWLQKIPVIDIPHNDFEQAIRDIVSNKKFSIATQSTALQ